MDRLERMIARSGRDVPAVDDAAESRAWQVLSRRIDADTPSPSIGPRRRVSAVRVRMLVAASIATMLVLAGVLLPPRLGGPGSAQAALEELAATVLEGSPLVLPADAYLHRSVTMSTITKGSGLSGGTWSFRVGEVQRSWRAADGSGLIVTTFGEPEFLTDNDEAAWVVAGRPALVPDVAQEVDYGPGTFPVRDISQLPADAGAIEEALRSGQFGPPPADALGLVDVVGEMLSDQLVPPAVRAALLQVLADAPGIEALGAIDDPLGRSGLGFRVMQGARAETLIFDADTADLLTHLVTRTVDGVEHTSWKAFGPTLVVDRLGGSG